jgi:hypothetical protein
VGLIPSAGLVGCGGKTPTTACHLTGVAVFPQTATIDYTALPPGNTQHFSAFATSASPGCGFQLRGLSSANWTVFDPVNVSIGADNKSSDFGTATCKNATAGAVTVTAVVPADDGTNLSNTTSLTCN